MTDNNVVRTSNERVERMLAAALAHRGCCGTEHDPPNGKLHGCCVVCGVPWPCDTAKAFLVTPVETTTEQSVGKLVIDYAMELETTRKALAETIEYARQWMPSDRYRHARLMCRGVVPSSSEEPTPHKYSTNGPCDTCGGQPGDAIHAVNGEPEHG